MNVLVNWSVAGGIKSAACVIVVGLYQGGVIPEGWWLHWSASRRTRAGELLEPRGKASSNLTTAAGHGVSGCRGPLASVEDR